MMHKALSSQSTTIFISAAAVLVIILVGLTAFGISVELEKARRLAGLSGAGDFDPNSLPAPSSGIPGYESGRSQGFGHSLESGRPVDCEGVIYRVAENGTRFVRESGGGRYYGADVDNMFEIYTLDYGYLVQAETPGLDAHTFRKLKHALYNCDRVYTESGLQMALNLSEIK
jgi:hypothetical protein